MHERPEIDREYAIILEALGNGVVPSEEAALELVALGILEKGASGYRMTLAARLKLEALRIRREREGLELLSQDISGWAKSGYDLRSTVD